MYVPDRVGRHRSLTIWWIWCSLGVMAAYPSKSDFFFLLLYHVSSLLLATWVQTHTSDSSYLLFWVPPESLGFLVSQDKEVIAWSFYFACEKNFSLSYHSSQTVVREIWCQLVLFRCLYTNGNVLWLNGVFLRHRDTETAGCYEHRDNWKYRTSKKSAKLVNCK